MLVAGVFTLLPWILPVDAQSNATNDELLPLLQSISAQQKLIDENQTNIDKSISTIQENMRQAKIYISRAGAGKAAKWKLFISYSSLPR